MLVDEELQEAPARKKAAGRAFRFILLLGLLDAFGPLGIDMYLPAFPEIERDLKAPGGAMQLTLSLFLAGLAVGQLVRGPISDRVGRRKPLLVGSALFAASGAVDRGPHRRQDPSAGRPPEGHDDRAEGFRSLNASGALGSRVAGRS